MLDSGQMPAEASDGYLAYIYFTLILDYLSVLVLTLDSGLNAWILALMPDWRPIQADKVNSKLVEN